MEINSTSSIAENRATIQPDRSANKGISKPASQTGDKVTLSKNTSPGNGKKCDCTELTEEEKQIVARLKAIDQEVRAHEQAHLAVAGPFANGGPSFQYQKGPDGKMYAVGGEVSIDTSKVPGDPSATIQKAEAIKRAALAPAHPSGQDLQVAAQAQAMEEQARQESYAQKTDETGKNLDVVV